ncbi:MAG: hypothetical protein ACJA09_002980 [Alcanivorax sp.]|jgi:hypothetical protein
MAIMVFGDLIYADLVAPGYTAEQAAVGKLGHKKLRLTARSVAYLLRQVVIPDPADGLIWDH